RQRCTEARLVSLSCNRRIASLWVLSRIPFHNQTTWAAERKVVYILEFLLGQPHVREATRQFIHNDLHFHAADILAKALMGTKTECEVLHGIIATNVEQVRICKLARIMVGRVHDE